MMGGIPGGDKGVPLSQELGKTVSQIARSRKLARRTQQVLMTRRPKRRDGKSGTEAFGTVSLVKGGPGRHCGWVRRLVVHHCAEVSKFLRPHLRLWGQQGWAAWTLRHASGRQRAWWAGVSLLDVREQDTELRGEEAPEVGSWSVHRVLHSWVMWSPSLDS